ncbi:MAG: cystathionine gamma-synthase [Rhodobacteraceae bacterium]|nr:cystathionine gamma-synthase [Paracoccaceae bacterium]
MREGAEGRTIAANNGIATDAPFHSVTPPLYASTTYAFPAFNEKGPYDYSRTRNPTRDLLADTIAKLEGGAGGIILSSGMAAIDLVVSQLTPNATVVAPYDCYAGTYRLLSKRQERQQIQVLFIDQSDPTTVAAALDKRPALFLIETPSNPLMRIVDIQQISEKAKTVDALVAVDNTFLSPALQKPLSLGADIVIHSTTKYINGHSDVVGGAVVARDKARIEAMADWANTVGTTGSPMDAYLTLRGIRTLFPRIEAQQESALELARFLSRHQMVKAVHYPGLGTHPGHDIARRQQRGFGAMLSFEIHGDMSSVRRLVDRLEIFTLAESLGGIESLIAHPATMTHANMPMAARTKAGITDALLRLSVGLEATADLRSDVEAALAAT